MNTIVVQTLALVTFHVLLLFPVEGKSTILNKLHQTDVPSVPSPMSPRVRDVEGARALGCECRPWVCSHGEFPPRSLCCRNRCVDVTSDRNNCGFCRIRCPFNWECCGGLCRDINWSVFNCGKCGHRCPFGVLCIFGMCGYA